MGRLLLPPVAAASLPAATAVLLDEDLSTTAFSVAAILARAALQAAWHFGPRAAIARLP